MLRQHPVDVKNFFEKSCTHERPSPNFDEINGISPNLTEFFGKASQGSRRRPLRWCLIRFPSNTGQRNRAARIGAAASRMFAIMRSFSDMGNAAKRARACSLPAKMRARISSTVIEPRNLSLPVFIKEGIVFLLIGW
jgi:hypothetical protein